MASHGSDNHPSADRPRGVARYLSDEWFHQLGARVGGPAAPADLVLQHLVTAGPEGDVDYHVRVASGAVTIWRGPASDPDVTFAEDYDTAAAIASGRLSAPAALLAGRIRVGGDMAALIAHQDHLAVNDPIPAAVRASTTY
jgi:predicted lipid carrier protein YhbT